MMNRFLLTICIVLASVLAHAGKFSYLYIQGDQKTPFYVKLEDAMQPRFSKNYCIIPKLAPGPIHIEILFQQNLFPPQEFNILIPEDGARGFLLVNNKEKGFMLYDLQQGFYLKAGNLIGEDRIPSKKPTAAIPPAPAVQDAGKDVTAVAAKSAKPASAAKEPKAKTKLNPDKTSISGAQAPVFIQDLELSGRKEQESESIPVEKSAAKSPGADAGSAKDCGPPLSTEDFEGLFSEYSSKSNDEEKLEFVYGQLGSCYESWQARALAERLTSDVARFELLKKIHPRISDRAAFPLLDDLIRDETWKVEFEKLTQH